MSDYLEKRLEKASNEQSANNMVFIKECKDDKRRYVEEYNIPAIIGLTASCVRWYEKFCNTKLSLKEY
jgi:hypothetical protein